MDKFSIALDIINNVSIGNNDVALSKGKELYKFFEDYPSEIINNEMQSFHIGSAFYFYRKIINVNEDSLEKKLSIMISFANLYKSLAYNNMQTLIAAYRLHILLAEERHFFEHRLMGFVVSLHDFLSGNHVDVKKKIDKLYFAMQYCLFKFSQGNANPIAWTSLDKEERQAFENIYKQFKIKHSICDFGSDENFRIGNKVLNALYTQIEEESIPMLKELGTI